MRDLASIIAANKAAAAKGIQPAANFNKPVETGPHEHRPLTDEYFATQRAARLRSPRSVEHGYVY